MKKRIMAFVYAFRGLINLSKEVHFRFHLIVASLLCAYAIYLDLSINKWLWLISAISIVLISEAINSLIEELCNLIDKNYNENIKQIKDSAAAFVLIAVFYALSVGYYLFLY